jgi:hypothetical protein
MRNVNVVALPTMIEFGKRKEECIEPRTRLLTTIVPDGMDNPVRKKWTDPLFSRKESGMRKALLIWLIFDVGTDVAFYGYMLWSALWGTQ